MELVYFLASGAVRLSILAFLPRLSKNSMINPVTLGQDADVFCQRYIPGAYTPLMLL